MIFAGAFGKNLEILTREMDVAALRQNVIANNIANADTPNFKRSVVNFESQLQRALDSERRAALPPGHHGSAGHPVRQAHGLEARCKPRRVLDYLTEAKNNGNNVDIEQEGIERPEQPAPLHHPGPGRHQRDPAREHRA